MHKYQGHWMGAFNHNFQLNLLMPLPQIPMRLTLVTVSNETLASEAIKNKPLDLISL